MIKCPHCEEGKMSISVTVYGKGPLRSNQEAITCVYCSGKGEISEELAARIKAENDVWCKCETPGDPVFVDDAPTCKHHWDCAACGGLIQIG
jgi:hypothetical protein